ncbi:MAG TPA: nitrilase family protein [Eudoraea sp.]|nr:nitrilase family protein [Eudoraea sp.]
MSMELKVALLQSAIVWEMPEQNRANFSRMIEKISDDTDVIILPEMFTTGFTMSPQRVSASEGPLSVRWMQEEAAGKNAALVGSMVFCEEGKYYNRLYFVHPDGSIATYNKRHTFSLAGEDKVYNKGEGKIISTFRGFNFHPLICYDLRFPVWSRNTGNYDVLIYVANWPKVRNEAWDALLKARAIENMAYCIGVNRVGSDPNGNEYSGHSGVYDCLGDSMVFSEQETILYATLSKDHIDDTRKRYNFLKDGDSFTLLS